MLNNLTGLRFYAAFWVFLYHFFPVYTELRKIKMIEIGYLGVDVFFILSGFILTYVYYDKLFVRNFGQRDYYNFIVKRFAKIYPLHFVITLLFIPLLFVGKYVFHQDSLKVYPDSLINNFLLVHAWNTTSHISWNFPSWSVSAEWFAYLFLFFPAAYVYKKSSLLFYFLSCSVIVYFIFSWFQIPKFIMDKYTTNGLPRIIPEFLLGMLIGIVRVKVTMTKVWTSLLFLSGILTSVILFSFEFYAEQLCILAFAAVILSLSYKNFFDFLFSTKRMIYFGNISYAFYMTQFLSLIVSEQIFKRMFSADSGELSVIGLKFLAAFFLNFIFAILAYHYIEEPLRKKIVNNNGKK